MPSIGDITGRIVIVDKGSPALHQFESNIKGSIRTIEIAGGRLTATIEGMLSKTALLATAGMIARTGFQFLKEAGQEAIEAERAFAQLLAGVESTGGAAGKSAEELSALADELSKLTGFDDELIAGGEAILLTFRRVRGEAFDQTMKLALDLSTRFGKDIDSSVTMIAKALDMLMAGSAKGLSALSKAGVTFTDQQKKTMEQLVRTGQAAEAQRLFFRELEQQFGGSAKAARETMGGALQALEVSWSNLKERIGQFGLGSTDAINKVVDIIDTMTQGLTLFDIGISLAMAHVVKVVGWVRAEFLRLAENIAYVRLKLIEVNPFAGAQEQVIAINKYLEANRARIANQVETANKAAKYEADAARTLAQALGILPKAATAYKDVGEEIDGVKSKQRSWFDDLYANLARQEQALDLFRQAMPVEQTENLIEAAEALGKTNLLDPLVLKAGTIKDRIDDIRTAFRLADEAKKKFAELGTLDDLIQKQFDNLPAGSNDPAMQKLIANLRAIQQLTDSVATEEERKTKAVAEALALGIKGETLQRILLANADQWNIELDETQIKFNEIYEKLSYIAEGIAFDLVSNWRRAWEENESIVDATVDTLRDSFLNVLQDIISQWLSAWFKAMAAWLARWIATQKIAQAASASTGGGFQNSSAGLGNFAYGYGKQAVTGSGASTGSMSAGVEAYGGWALAAFGLYVIYKGFVERERNKFAKLTIEGGKWQVTASRGQKYLDGVSQAAETIVNNVTHFLDEIDVTMTRMGTVIIESSKSGWNVSIPGSTGKLFSSMEEAISYAQVLMMKYGEFADSVSTLVKGVITSTKAISIEDLASDLDWARMLETQNLEQAALDVSNAMDVAIANWKRAEELFLSFYSVNLPAFEAAIDSIITKLGSDLVNAYNRLAGIEEDPEKAWQRQKAAYNAQRLLVLAQLKLWELEIQGRIANYNAQLKILGGGPGAGGRDGGGRVQGGGGGILGLAFSMLQAASIVSGAAEVLDPALQALLDIQALITQAINETPPELTDDDFPGTGRKGGGGRNRKEMRADIRDEIDTLEAEAKGALHASFNDLNNNLAAFRDRAKEAKLPAAELARGIELLTEAFRRSVQTQAREYAGLDTELSRRLKEIQDFFDEVRELGPDATGLSSGESDNLESQALAKLGAELSQTILEFAGLSDPMLAITMRADELRRSVIEFAEAAGWSSEQIDEALRNIDRGVEGQRLQGIHSALSTLFNILKQANLFQEEGLQLERENALIQLQLLEAQFRFYDALTAQIEAMLDAARDFVNSADFGSNQFGSSGSISDPINVKVVQVGNPWGEFSAGVKEMVEAWREGIKDFVDSTKSLLTDENLTNLTQAEQLDVAKSELEQLIATAKGGDLAALNKLDAARREYLEELRESEGGGFGYQKGFEWVMGQTADILAGAQQGEQALMATEFQKLTQAWQISVEKLSAEMVTTLYATTDALVAAIYDAIGGVPGFASGGVVMKGPRLVRVAEYVPEAILPLDKLASLRSAFEAKPYSYQPGYGPLLERDHSAGSFKTHDMAGRFDRDALARLSSLELSNESISRSLISIKDDISIISRRRM